MADRTVMGVRNRPVATPPSPIRQPVAGRPVGRALGKPSSIAPRPNLGRALGRPSSAAPRPAAPIRVGAGAGARPTAEPPRGREAFPPKGESTDAFINRLKAMAPGGDTSKLPTKRPASKPTPRPVKRSALRQDIGTPARGRMTGAAERNDNRHFPKGGTRRTVGTPFSAQGKADVRRQAGAPNTEGRRLGPSERPARIPRNASRVGMGGPRRTRTDTSYSQSVRGK